MGEAVKTTRTRHKIDPHVGVKFSKDYQPSPEAKSAGARKPGLLRALLDLKPKGDSEALQKIRAQVMNLTGLSREQVDDMTMEALMHYRQQEKAINLGDTYAYNSVLNREYGPPAETMNLDIRQAIVIQVISPEQAEQVTRLEDVR